MSGTGIGSCVKGQVLGLMFFLFSLPEGAGNDCHAGCLSTVDNLWAPTEPCLPCARATAKLRVTPGSRPPFLMLRSFNTAPNVVTNDAKA